MALAPVPDLTATPTTTKLGPDRARLKDLMRRLAEATSTEAPILSLYIDVRPEAHGERPGERNELTVVRDRLNAIAGTLEPHTDARESFDADRRRIERLLESEDLNETDVIGGNKFISSTLEYRFPISETIGLQGVVFFDTGNAFAEDENLFDVTNWRYGTGLGVQWFSPFGPLAVVVGFPLDRLSVEDLPVFEFSVGGQGF